MTKPDPVHLAFQLAATKAEQEDRKRRGVPSSWLLDKSIADLERRLDVLSGNSPEDDHWVPATRLHDALMWAPVLALVVAVWYVAFRVFF